MKTLGFDKPLYILPFDHRGSFETKMFGWHGDLNAEQTAQIAAAKQVIYDGFKAAIAAGVPKEKAGILVDEQFGAAILRDAAAKGYTTACPAEKSGQDEFDFEYGEDFAQHIEAFHPTFCKVLVRYNPEGDATLNQRQAARLKRLSDYLHDQSQSRFMFELLVPAEKAQLERLEGDKKAYDLELRPRLMVQAIEQLQDAGVEPDVWKIEGLDRRDDCAKIVAAAHRGGRDKVGCIVLGRGEDDTKVHEWLATAAAVPGFIGFAVGRTDFWEPLVSWRAKKITREAAVAEIARRYQEFVDIFEKASLPKRAESLTSHKQSIMKKNTTMQLGMIGLGRMGANMVRRLIKGGHRVRRLRRLAESRRGRLANGEGDRRLFTRRLRAEARPSRARSGSWCRRRSSTRPSPNSSRCWKQATSSSTAATRITSTTSAAPRNSRRRASTTSTSAPAAASGDSNAATA